MTQITGVPHNYMDSFKVIWNSIYKLSNLMLNLSNISSFETIFLSGMVFLATIDFLIKITLELNNYYGSSKAIPYSFRQIALRLSYMELLT